MADPILEQIVDYAGSLKYEDLSTHVVHEAKRRIVDTIACALGGYEAPPVRIAREMAVSVAAPASARVFGSLTCSTPELAAFANGVMCRYLDYNDSSLGGNQGAHPSDNLGAIVAAAEATHATGRDFLLALTISYEIQCRMAVSIPFLEKGWDQPVAGVIGAAAACGRLLALTKEQMRNAIALAIIPNFSSYQTRVGQLSMWKSCAGAHAARQGLYAATLASKGMTGPHDPISGVHGLCALTVGEPCEVQPFARSGNDFAIALSAMKKHPVRTFGQIMVDTALDLRKEVQATDIASLRLRTFHASYKQGQVEHPQSWNVTTRETADHSLLFAIAATLLDGQLTPGSYERQRFLDADVRELIKRMSVTIDPGFDAEYKQGIRNCVLEATLTDGPACSSWLRITPEEVARGPSDADIEQKLERLTDGRMRPGERRMLLDVLWNIENAADVSTLIDRTALP